MAEGEGKEGKGFETLRQGYTTVAHMLKNEVNRMAKLDPGVTTFICLFQLCSPYKWKCVEDSIATVMRNPVCYVQEECVIPCPFDCKLSDWSSWGSCSSSCGIGVRIRSKWLKEKPYSGGRPCPKLDLKNQNNAIRFYP
ncbi:thrombospondin type-1 domain-containing protein 7A [Cricetulus griseus]|nr:thrombospondin type-1 domain-containing protein 7A [Cricetulus griseus]